MFRFYDNPDTLIAEQDQFERDIAEFVAGNINPIKFKAIRVAHGVYEQRQLGTYMIRIRCAAGGITPSQLKKVAELGEKYGSGEVHFTTRSEVQVHDVLIENVMNVIRGLNEVDLSSRGGGGNTIRNILTSTDSGISKDDVFDVDPYAIALTTRMIHEDDSWNLPRKFKIAFSNNEKDTAFTQATCLGFVATIQDGQKGFHVYCAGGMGAKPMVGHELFGFVPESQVYHVTRAMKTMFDKNGDRRHKYSNRLKFLWKKLERDDFMGLFREEFDKIKDDASLALELPELKNEAKDTDLAVQIVDSVEFEAWKQRYVSEQKQDGLVSIQVPLRLGDLLKKDADPLCDFLDHFGDNTIRCGRGQNMRLRNIPAKYLGNLFNVVSAMDQPLVKLPVFFSNIINCTGAQTCKLGICLPRGLSDAIRERLVESQLDFDKISSFRIHASGCPNTCGMHHIADLGFFGKVGRKDGQMYPMYNVLAGARVGQVGQLQYAQKEGEVPAKFVPEFVHDFLADYISKVDQYATYHDYLDAEGREQIVALCTKYKEVPGPKDDLSYYIDWGAEKPLSLDELGTAECSAGMFDMIDVDKKTITKTRKSLDKLESEAEIQEALYQILHASARMLLVTRGLDAKDEKAAFELFAKHFVKTDIVSEKYADILVLGKLKVLEELEDQQDEIFGLADEVLELYKGMDDSLKFHPKPKAEEASSDDASGTVVDNSQDFRGVACPMNFVRTKLALEPMQSGQVLEILLDDGEPIQNVPNSVELEGHKVLEKTRDGDHWKVVIKKA